MRVLVMGFGLRGGVYTMLEEFGVLLMGGIYYVIFMDF